MIDGANVRQLLTVAAASRESWSAQMLERIDAQAWCCPVVCSGRGQHNDEVLGLVYEDASQVYWAPRLDYDTGSTLVSFTRVWTTDQTTVDEAREIERLHGYGSLLITCPQCSTSPRVPDSDWMRCLETLRDTRAQRLDLSRL